MRRELLAAGVLGLVVGSIWVLARTPKGPPLATPGASAAATTGAPSTASPGAATPTETARESRARPPSLRRTRTDGGLVVDDGGRFVPTLDARRLFDYFLTATGEVDGDALRARIVAEIERRLAPEAARDATALLDRYLAYRERVRLLATGEIPDGGDLDARLAALLTLRREMLGPEAADAFFAEEEAHARGMLEVRRIAADTTLTAEERVRRMEAAAAALEADLPPEVREARAATRLAETLRRAEDEARANGGGADDVQAVRERLAGPEAAARLAELDRRRADWQARVDAFRAARARLASDAALTPGARAAATERLLAESFAPAERLRIEALDRIAADAGAPSP